MPELGISTEKVGFLIEKARQFDVKEGVSDPESCRQLLGLIRNQDVGQTAQRELARSRLQLIRTMCADATTVVTLITSALGLLGFATG